MMVWGNFIINEENGIKEIKHKNYKKLNLMALSLKFKIKEQNPYVLIGEYSYNGKGKGYLGYDVVLLQSEMGEFNLLEGNTIIEKNNYPIGNGTYEMENKKVKYLDDLDIVALYHFFVNSRNIKLIFFLSCDEDWTETMSLRFEDIICIKETLELYFNLRNGKVILP